MLDKLTNKRIELVGLITKLTGDLEIDGSGDEIDRMQAAQARERVADELERVREILRDVDHALQKILAGAFGVCEECEELIGGRRLAYLPWARLCVVCKECEERENLGDDPRVSRLVDPEEKRGRR